jgi:hypothetical protein
MDRLIGQSHEPIDRTSSNTPLLPPLPPPHNTAVDEGAGDVQLLNLPDDFYVRAAAANPYACTEEERGDYAAALGRRVMERLCDSVAYVNYAAADRALQEVIVPCATCTHMLVTSGERSYAPDFLPLATRRQEDLVVVGYAHAHNSTAAALNGQSGRIDLGAVLLRRRVLEGGRRLFLTSLPESSHAQEVCDADFWFLKDALNHGYSQALLLDRVLMYSH